jgi:aromatic ring-opening dioxygenase catalytic subunit (LigB family)
LEDSQNVVGVPQRRVRRGGGVQPKPSSESRRLLCAVAALAEETNPLIDYEKRLGEEAMLAIPTPDHYLPLLYVIGTRTPSEPVTFPVEGVDGGSISMLAVRAGEVVAI